MARPQHCSFWTFPKPLTPWTIAASLSSGWYGISGTALNWVRSYLSNRVQRVKLLFKLGEPFKTDYGVLQGSVLGPLLITLYTTPLSSVISRHNICHHLYADDTQIYLSLSKTDPEMSLSLVQQCLQDVSDWMIASKLKLNPDKTELILIGTKAQRDKFKKYFPTKLLDQDVTSTDSARNLGVEFDKDFKFKKHISKVCQSCYYHIRDFCHLRRCLTAAVTKTIPISLVSSKLDYCDPILYHIPNRPNKQGAECSELLGQGCDPFFTILQCYTSSLSQLLYNKHTLPYHCHSYYLTIKPYLTTVRATKKQARPTSSTSQLLHNKHTLPNHSRSYYITSTPYPITVTAIT